MTKGLLNQSDEKIHATLLKACEKSRKYWTDKYIYHEKHLSVFLYSDPSLLASKLKAINELIDILNNDKLNINTRLIMFSNQFRNSRVTLERYEDYQNFEAPNRQQALFMNIMLGVYTIGLIPLITFIEKIRQKTHYNEPIIGKTPSDSLLNIIPSTLLTSAVIDPLIQECDHYIYHQQLRISILKYEIDKLQAEIDDANKALSKFNHKALIAIKSKHSKHINARKNEINAIEKRVNYVRNMAKELPIKESEILNNSNIDKHVKAFMCKLDAINTSPLFKRKRPISLLKVAAFIVGSVVLLGTLPLCRALLSYRFRGYFSFWKSSEKNLTDALQHKTGKYLRNHGKRHP